MIDADITIQQRHLTVLRDHLLSGDGREQAAYVLFGVSKVSKDPFDGRRRLRLLVREVLPLSPDEILSADNQHITWSTARFVRLLGEAERQGLEVGIAHSHPLGPSTFSDQDDKNEKELVRLVQNRNGLEAVMPSLLLARGSELSGRIWTSFEGYVEVSSIRTVGPSWGAIDPLSSEPSNDEAFHRQNLALGGGFSATMRAMRFGVIGAGGTGSPLLQQLARMGAGHIAVFDPDTVEFSNLNRLYGATKEDAENGVKKIDVAIREVQRMGLGTEIVGFDSWIGHEKCRDALKSMDVIFGCTDDNDGRSMLNRLAYYYLIPVIDIGLALKVATRFGEKVLEGDGRVTVLGPGSACLLCRKVINPVLASEEALRRQDPLEYNRRKAEAYVRGEGNPAPAVISFTTSVATMAIEELIQRIQHFRGHGREIANRVRKFNMAEDFRPGTTSDGCRICGNDRIHGRGDVEPFLGRAG